MAVTILEGLGHPLFRHVRAAHIGGQSVQMRDAEGNIIGGALPGAAPVVVVQPSILPATAVIGTSITLNLGAANGSPTPVATWDFTLNGVSIRDRLDQGELTMELTAPGTYVLSVGWVNSHGTVSATSAQHTVAAPVIPTINYDTQALAYFNAETAYTGTAADVAALTARGTGHYVFSKTGTGTTVQRAAGGFVFGDGVYLQSQTLTAQPMTDGIFVVADVTLDSYGSNIGQIVDGTGGHVKIRNASGALQITGVDDTAVNLALGSVSYGQRMVISAQIDDVADVLSGHDVAGNVLSTPHAGLTDPALGRLTFGRYLRGTIHRMAIVGRAEGQPWPVTMREVVEDFRRGA